MKEVTTLRKAAWLPLMCIFPVLLIGCGKETGRERTSDSITSHVVQKDRARETRGKRTGAGEPEAERASSTVAVSRVAPDALLRGATSSADGTPVRSFHLTATPRGLYQEKGNPGHFAGKITTDDDGEFVVSNLLQETYTLKIRSTEFHPLETNVFLCEAENYLDFLLVPCDYLNLNGKVIVESTGEKASGVTVQFVPSEDYLDPAAPKEPVITTSTDQDGGFAFALPIRRRHLGSLVVDEPGFARVKCVLYKNYAGEEITIPLRQIACIVGAAKTPEGKPAAKVNVRVINDSHHRYSSSYGKKSSFSQRRGPCIRRCFSYRAEQPTGVDGAFVISNVAAPEVYAFAIDSHDYFLPGSPFGDAATAGVSVSPHETALATLTVYPKSIVLLKVRDDGGEPVLEYDLAVLTEYENGSSHTSFHVHLLSDAWHQVHAPIEKHDTKLSLTVSKQDEVAAMTNDIPLVGGETNFITVTLSSSRQVSGFVYLPDDSPAVDAWISANIKNSDKFRYAYTDHLGYFQVTGLPAQSNDTIDVSALSKGRDYTGETNVPVGTEDMELRLALTKKLFGRVCLEHPSMPATNFTVDINNWKSESFAPGDGRFSINMLNRRRRGTGFVYVTSAGYAPKKVYFDFLAGPLCDLGDIVLAGGPATISARVVDQNGRPVTAHVYLFPAEGYETTSSDTLNVKTDADGCFTFTDLPIQPVFVRAYTFYGKPRSDTISPQPGETTTLPDLVVFTTNAALVRITFILPTGKPAAGALVHNARKTADVDGAIEKELRFRTYGDWRVTHDDKSYRAEPFTVSPATERLRVKLHDTVTMNVTFMLDDRLMRKEFIRYWHNGEYHYGNLDNGVLVVDNLPGEYVFYNETHSVAAEVTLSGEKSNVVYFTTGTASLDVTLPYEGQWQVDAMLRIGGVKANIATSYTDGDSAKNVSLDHLPGGDYKLRAYCFTPSARTNISTDAMVEDGGHTGTTF